MNKKILLFTLSLVFTSLLGHSTQAQVLPSREQATIIDEVINDHLNNLLPTLMERTGIDIWVF